MGKHLCKVPVKPCYFTDKYVGAKLEVFIYDYQLQKVMEIVPDEDEKKE